MNQPDIVVISYNTPHRKTQDVLFQLKVKGYQNVTVLALPFVFRENPFKPIYAHRPSTAVDVSPEILCERFLYRFKTVNADEIHPYLNENPNDFVLITGAGLLPDELVENHKLINSHPGWLPKVRGLDSLKWAIHKKQTLGVTCHYVDSEADAGFLIEQREVPVYANDTFHSVAYRQYEIEIDMLVNSIEVIPSRTEFTSLSTTEFEATRRMPKSIEENLMQEFEVYKEEFC
ncbi:formyltransferase family protein [Moheibacter sediminis]|uniref:phosphoribosylglycinamide formyltransferase 1 n=1 Tax=Moheibacter sediminis TaxID=1434700 RepID=A0A1W2AZH5_9FLAO|nr:formyltransferase family protein [Moheibacter sediminis]SMC65930.1 phosphoribosylglycinamide formyltransferase-1 [Moheibacter sediminis]